MTEFSDIPAESEPTSPARSTLFSHLSYVLLAVSIAALATQVIILPRWSAYVMKNAGSVVAPSANDQRLLNEYNTWGGTVPMFAWGVLIFTSVICLSIQCEICTRIRSIAAWFAVLAIAPIGIIHTFYCLLLLMD